jgi:aryl-alcohol dehydrogenase-like predicted oxidoreductase
MLDRHIEAHLLPTVGRLGIGLTVFSPLAQGLLTGKYNQGVPAASRGAQRELDLAEATLAKVRQLTRVAADLQLSMSQLALTWLLRRPEVSAVITGASSPSQVQENIRAAEVQLDSAVLTRIDEILEEAAGVGI